ncbi:FAD-binding protein [Candidatus Peregrinibacteria bacterium]|nr:FAD-binding protein [Candidatus Peregrinibacteria bacterium]
MTIQENVAVGSKTTMRIGGAARYYAEILTKEDAEEALRFAAEKNLPLFVLGGGSNTVFADGTINVLVVRIKADAVTIHKNRVTVQAGKNLPMLINELAKERLDLSPLTGILGTVGGAIFGNAGQGPTGIWIDHYVESVTALVNGKWKTFSQTDCGFRYRESFFKDQKNPVIIWETTLQLPSRPEAEIKGEIEKLLKRRIETQPHVKTAGSCFKTVGDTPAWKLIDAAGLRGFRVGDVQIAEKHANFLLNIGKATYANAKAVVDAVQKKIPEKLEVEMRFVESNGRTYF